MRSPWLLVPPPLLFVGAFAAGVAFDRVVPLPLLPGSLHDLGRGLGIALIAVAAALIAPSIALFIYRRTTIVPHSARARALVAAGPFRVTRNPMYLGLAVATLGGTLVANVVWPLLTAALPLWVMDARVIPHEEATLSRIFGDDYRAYQKKVRRWI